MKNEDSLCSSCKYLHMHDGCNCCSCRDVEIDQLQDKLKETEDTLVDTVRILAKTIEKHLWIIASKKLPEQDDPDINWTGLYLVVLKQNRIAVAVFCYKTKKWYPRRDEYCGIDLTKTLDISHYLCLHNILPIGLPKEGKIE